MAFLSFPGGFQWGVAAAAYQVEGAVHQDGRGLSIWDTFSHQPGRIFDGTSGDIACDHYHRYREDIALMRDLGVQSYRLSIAWPRVMPAGRGPVNEAGLAFYDRLVDELLANGIEPAVTLYHWDLPQALQDLGGWNNRDTAGWFADYAAAVFRRLGDRVTRWITLNEPYIFVMFGNSTGWMAPGIADHSITARSAHHALLGHGRAVEAFRASGRPGEVGITNFNTLFEPVDGQPVTLAAVERARDFETRLFHDPVFGKGYPAHVHKFYAERGAPLPILGGDLEIIARPIDFLGVNIYSRQRIAAGNPGGLGFLHAPPTLPVLPMGYEAAPHCLGEFVRWISAEYGRPKIYITENGVCDNTGLGPDGQVHDAVRVDLLRGFLAGLHSAIADGVDVRAYYQWSLMDNWEWAWGFFNRFGLFHTDFETQVRTPKDSAQFYRELITRNGFDG